MRWILSPFLLIALSLTSVVAQEDEAPPPPRDHITLGREKAGVLRVMRAALSAPDINRESVLEDMKRFIDPEVFPEDDEIEELLIDIEEAAPSSCANTDAAVTGESDELPKYVDRHVRVVNSIVNDDDCMNRVFDATDADFNPREAAAVLNKCRLLVLRNAFAVEHVEEFKKNVEIYLNDLHYGRINATGTTTLNEQGFYVRRDPKRFDVLFPESILHPDIAASPPVLKILGDRQALGSKSFVANTMGSVIAESGATIGRYHIDDGYVFEDRSFENYGIAGGDVPPYAVTAFIPLQDTTLAHGPTEFCMGTNWMKGMDVTNPRVRDKSLIAKGTPWYDLAKFEQKKDSCPEKYRRKPLGNKGDVVFFDYTITHRGTANVSPDLRAMAYIFYSRRWFRDWNFALNLLDHTYRDAKRFPRVRKLTETTRFAVVKENKDVSYKPVPLRSIENFMHPHTKITVVNTDVENASLYSDETFVKDVPVGKEVSMNLPMGSTLTLYNYSSESDITSWDIGQEKQRITLSSSDLPVTSTA